MNGDEEGLYDSADFPDKQSGESVELDEAEMLATWVKAEAAWKAGLR